MTFATIDELVVHVCRHMTAPVEEVTARVVGDHTNFAIRQHDGELILAELHQRADTRETLRSFERLLLKQCFAESVRRLLKCDS